MDAVIIAGGIPRPGDPLWEETRGGPKAMIAINGKPMIQWIIEAVCLSANIEKIYVVGLPPESVLPSTKPLTRIPDQGGIIENLAAGAGAILEEAPSTEYFLGISSDIPCITTPMIDHLLLHAPTPGVDIFYNVIPRPLMESTFPGVRRTFMRFGDGYYCGGDLHVINARRVIPSDNPVRKLVSYRKIPLKLIAVLGIEVLLRTLFFRPTLEVTEQIIFRRTGIVVKTMISPFAEIGMDIDKPAQLAQVRQSLPALSGESILSTK
jgi:molybdopterin-guanine dinucleotide biosynthesis protein A